jgi:hypothetical protein
MFDHPSYDAHEGVHLFHDADSGLKAIIAVHSTARGPAAGGCRMWNYATGEAMLKDALRLSQGMSYKNAMADIPLGGGKAVIWGNARTDKSPELFRAFGRAVNSLQGLYTTAEDVGVSVADMAIVREETPYVAGLDQGKAASGDPSPVTAKGIFLGLIETAKRALGTDDLTGKTVAVQGVGHVGSYLCDHLAKAGATLVITDIDKAALDAVAKRTGARIVAPDAITMSAPTSSHLAPWALSSMSRRWSASGSRRLPAVPTTSWSCRKWASCCAGKASSTRRTMSSMAAASSMSRQRFPATIPASGWTPSSPGWSRHWGKSSTRRSLTIPDQ